MGATQLYSFIHQNSIFVKFTAKRMLADGVPAEQVAKWTDIPVETLRS